MSILQYTINEINKHGSDCTYVSVAEGVYDIETLSTTNTNTNYTIRMYPQHFTANQYNAPNLVGKETIQFLLANSNLAFTPSVQDKIILSGVTYTVDSIKKHRANGIIVLYKLVSVKG